MSDCWIFESIKKWIKYVAENNCIKNKRQLSADDSFFLSIILKLKSALTSFQNINSLHQTCLGVASYSEFAGILSQATDILPLLSHGEKAVQVQTGQEAGCMLCQ